MKKWTWCSRLSVPATGRRDRHGTAGQVHDGLVRRQRRPVPARASRTWCRARRCRCRPCCAPTWRWPPSWASKVALLYRTSPSPAGRGRQGGAGRQERHAGRDVREVPLGQKDFSTILRRARPAEALVPTSYEGDLISMTRQMKQLDINFPYVHGVRVHAAIPGHRRRRGLHLQPHQPPSRDQLEGQRRPDARAFAIDETGKQLQMPFPVVQLLPGSRWRPSGLRTWPPPSRSTPCLPGTSADRAHRAGAPRAARAPTRGKHV